MPDSTETVTPPATPPAALPAEPGSTPPPATPPATPPAPPPATPPAEGKKGTEATPSDGPPETYMVTLPEGFKDLDKNLLERFTPIGKELKLSQASADKLVGLYADGLKQMHAQQEQAFKDTQAKWGEDLKADPVLGGAQLTATLATAQKALKQFGDDKLVAFIEAWGLGNQPDFVRMMAKVGQALGEDGFVKPASAGGGAARLTDGQVLYPTKPT